MSAVPTPYVPSFSFYDWSAGNPNVPAPGQKFDTEFTNIQTLFDAMQVRAALVQNDDGTIKNGSVGRNQLSSDFASGVGPPAPFTPFGIYNELDAVLYNGSWYWCLIPNGPGAFDSNDWQFVGTFFSDDPLLLSLDKGSLIDGILSADAGGRAKMADGYITAAKIANGVLPATNKAFASFDPDATLIAFNFSYVGDYITATCAEDLSALGITPGSSISFAGATGNSAILNGAWRIDATPDANTIKFHVVGTPAGAMTAYSGRVIAIYEQKNVFTISYVSEGVFTVVMNPALANSNYIILPGCTNANPSNQANVLINVSRQNLNVGSFQLLVSYFGSGQFNPGASQVARVYFGVFAT